MKTSFKWFVMIPLLLVGCSPKNSQPTEPPKDDTAVQTEPKTPGETKDNANIAAPEKDDAPADNAKEADLNTETAKDVGTNDAFRPFKFTIDLDQYYEQQVCNGETGQCKSYKDLMP